MDLTVELSDIACVADNIGDRLRRLADHHPALKDDLIWCADELAKSGMTATSIQHQLQAVGIQHLVYGDHK